MQDTLTKFSVALPLPDSLASTVADAFVKRYITLFGAPQALVSDRGANCMSKLFAAVAKRFKIKQLRTCAFTPRANPVERMHHTLSSYLKIFVNNKEDAWDEYVELATFSYNSMEHESTKATPFE